MRTRRDAIAVIGATVLAGCSAQSTATPDEAEADESNTELTIPITGLGEYEEKLQEYGPLEGQVDTLPGGVDTTPEDITTMVEEADSVVEERNWLAENTPVGEEPTYQVMNEYLTQKEPGEPSVQLNRNYVFLPGGEGIANMFTTVQNGQLQGQPSITYQVGANLATDHPNQEGHQALAALRDDTRWTAMIPADYNALQDRIEYAKKHEDATEGDVRNIRAYTFDEMSAALFGVGPDENFILYDGETSNLVNNNVQAKGDVSSEYTEADEYGTDTWTSAEKTESGWEFRTHPDWQLGDRLPGEK